MTSLCSVVSSTLCEAYTPSPVVTITETYTMAPTSLPFLTTCPSVTGETVYVCPTEQVVSTGPSSGSAQTLTIPVTATENATNIQPSNTQPSTSDMSIASAVSTTWSYTDTQTYYPDPYTTVS